MSQEQYIINQINNNIDFTFPHTTQTKRYIVGKKLLHESKNPSIYYENIYKDVYKFIREKSYLHKNKTIGGWYNKDKDTYCVDIGKSFNSLYKAIVFGLKHEQICIYDRKKEKTISIGILKNIKL